MTTELANAYLASNSLEAFRPLSESLASTSQRLARIPTFRQELADRPDGLGALIELVQQLWSSFQISDVAKSAEERQTDAQRTGGKEEWDARFRDIQLLVLTLRCLRNSMAACFAAQEQVYAQLDALLPLLRHVTGFAALTDPDTIPLSRTAAQMLSNMITSNEALQTRFWQELVMDREKNIVLRLLASPDTQTQAATQIMLINVVKPSPSRSEELCRSTAGVEILEALLSAAESVVLQTEDEPQEGLEESLGLIYGTFTHLFESGLASTILASLAPLETIGETDGQAISNAQVTMLKLLDSWLHFGHKQGGTSTAPGLDGLLDTFVGYSKFTRTAMQKGLASPEAVQDKRLIGVHHGLLLVLQCLLSVGLAAEAKSSSSPLLRRMRTEEELTSELVLLLHQTNEFAPPISSFKSTNAQLAPDGHVLSSTGASTKGKEPSYGFDNLKRDIVRVIGVLVFSEKPEPDEEVRLVQDRVREQGGLFDVLNMTVLDERNPYMREHAIFTLRYLLAGNMASQDLVRQLEPMAADGAIR